MGGGMGVGMGVGPPNTIGGIGNTTGVGPLANAVQAESMIINRSLSALGSVVKSLSETLTSSRSKRNRESQAQAQQQQNKDKELTPYKVSKLTRVLKDAFGGNCRTTLTLTASPPSYNISETINTIRFGQRAKRVLNTPKANIDKSIYEYKKLVSELKEFEIKNYKLFKSIINEHDIKSLMVSMKPNLLKDIESYVTDIDNKKNAEEKKSKKEKSNTAVSSRRSRRADGGNSSTQQQQQDDTRDDS